MFKDMDISRDIMRSFGESVKYRKNLPSTLELNIYVLTLGYWPTYPLSKVALPAEMSAYLEAFKGFYVSNHSGRVLQWQHSLGHCVLKAAFPKGNKELLVSLYQTVVLLAFNDADGRHLSFSEIQSTTGLEPVAVTLLPSRSRGSNARVAFTISLETGDLLKSLLSLSCGKVRVLLKEPKGREVNATDTFCLNDDFKHSLFRIKVNTIQMKETPEENTATTESVFQDRKYQVEAAIVRIMKTRKKMTHNALLQDLFDQLKFPAQAADLKKCIESLIDREYLERDKADATKYKYLA
ncbi:MAG: Cul4b protein [Olpidium bornovanus]|uniref:Cul4b protein n=1 Tax=Olpidium bornovanus TaxID=278681 RepID=A0A8H7ZXJ7_9FUNG|nr:MAG: Cul4b protein [Olpidium bornovanus]